MSDLGTDVKPGSDAGWLVMLRSELALLVALLFGVMPWLGFGAVRHADGLADLLGEPYGPLILTVSVITIEVVIIAAVMLTGDPPGE